MSRKQEILSGIIEIYQDKKNWTPPSLMFIANMLGVPKSSVRHYINMIRKPEIKKKTKKIYRITPEKSKDPILAIRARLKNNLCGRLRMSLKSAKTIKNNRTMDYVGCSKAELFEHLESRFNDGMTWGNYGKNGWEIDHIIPMSLFDLTIEEEIYKAMNFNNLQPLWASDNRRKSNKILTDSNPQF